MIRLAHTHDAEIFHTDYPPGHRMPAHRDRLPKVSILLRGELRETHAHGEVSASSGSVVVKSPSVAHSDHFGPTGATLLSLRPRDWPGGCAHLQYRWFHGGPTRAAATRLAAALTEPSPEPAEIEAVVRRFLDAIQQLHRPAQPTRPPAWLQTIQRHLNESYAAPTSVEDLARHAGVHPVHLTRSFQRHFGFSVTGYLRTLRVRAAAAALASSDTPLAELALQTGFADQSHLCRIFKADVSVTPGRYRALMRFDRRAEAEAEAEVRIQEV